MQLQDMKVSKGVEVFVTRDEYRYRLVSKVEETAPGKAYISLIASGPRVFAFKPSDYVEVVYKENERMWKFQGVKVSLSTVDGYQVHCLESFKDGVSFNRRDTYRVQIMTAMEITRYSKMSAESNVDMDDFDMDAPAKELIAIGIEKSMVNVVVKDISESGIGFHSPILMKLGDRIRVRFLTEFGFITCEGTVIREVEQIWSRYRLFYGCAFSKTDKNLGRYIFAQQRLQLSKERK